MAFLMLPVTKIIGSYPGYPVSVSPSVMVGCVAHW